MLQDWRLIPAVLLRQNNLHHPHPATVGVLLEQIEDYLIPKSEKQLFRNWKNTVMHDTPKGSCESFLIGLQPFASNKLFEDAQSPLRSFQKWGYSGSDIFINKAKSKVGILSKTGLNIKSREIKLQAFLRERKSNRHTTFTVDDYLHFIDHLISRRVAQLDLRKLKNIRTRGQTRARMYVILG
jgi:hypothetical protein